MINIIEQQKKRIRYMYNFMWKRYKKNVLADGGGIQSDIPEKYLKMAQENNLDKHIKFGWIGGSGIKQANGRVSKIYGLNTPTDITPINGIQSTTTYQPYIGGNIAPTENMCIKNPNGGNNYLTHDEISFAANEAWSVTTVFNRNYKIGLTGDIIYGNIYTPTRLQIHGSIISFYNQSGLSVIFNYNPNIAIGKTIIVSVIAENGNLSLVLNGILIETKVLDTTIILNSIIRAWTDNAWNLEGSLHAHIIHSQALTQSQITAEHNCLREMFPEIPSVQIGTQTWATSNCEMAATPMGNVIQEMQAATNVVYANYNFDSNINGMSSVRATIAWNSTDQCLTCTSTTNGIYAGNNATIRNAAVIGAIYKVSFKARRLGGTITGNPILAYGYETLAVISSPNISSAFQEYVYYAKANSDLPEIATSNSISSIGDVTEFDDIKLENICWSDSQNLYDAIYAQTTGTTAEKEYAALKAAAMWCHYNNDISLGAVYGKLYNWYAAKLLQTDIDLYNAENVGNEWGWRVPTSTDFNTLIDYLGGYSISGGKLKKEGLDYWLVDNSSGNTYGLSVIGTGLRQTIGGFYELKNQCYLRSTSYAYGFFSTDICMTSLSSTDGRYGFSLRLIKD